MMSMSSPNLNLNIKKTFAAVLQIKSSNSCNAALLIAAMDKYMIPRKMDAEATPFPVSLDIASLLPSLDNMKGSSLSHMGSCVK